MDLILLQGFNNYYNRVVKKYNNLSEYLTWATTNHKSYTGLNNINFNPNDGINTEQIINWDHDWVPDYLLVRDGEDPVYDEDGNIFAYTPRIVSKWFIIESKRLRGKQYHLQLRRDLIVDYFDSIKNAKCFIEKANLNPNDPFIFNSEDMTFNQIKQSETLLKDKSNCAWIVGYYTSGSSETVSTMEADITDYTAADYEIQSSFDDWKYSKYFKNETFRNVLQYDITTSLNNKRNSNTLGRLFYAITGSFDCSNRNNKATSSLLFGSDNVSEFEKQYSQAIFRKDTGAILNDQCFDMSVWAEEEIYPPFEFNDKLNNKFTLESLASKVNGEYINNAMTDYELSEISKYNGKIVKFSDGTTTEYIKLNFSRSSSTDTSAQFEEYWYGRKVKVIAKQLVAPMSTDITNGVLAAMAGFDPVLYDDYYHYIDIVYDLYNAAYETVDITPHTYSTSFDDTKYTLDDAPYRMFCIPYLPENDKTEITIIDSNTATELVIDNTSGFKIANKLAEHYGGVSGRIKDIQLLPYCPIEDLLTDTAGEMMFDSSTDQKYTPIKTAAGTPNEKVVNYIFFARKSSFNRQIPFEKSVRNVKIESQTDMYRLVSPNYNGQFEFNLAKNNGITYFNVDCTYKPYNPYIHINPNFGGLYGGNYNDARGLICNGDFSLTMINDAWAQYEITNKNYQNIFDRQIQNIEVNNSIGLQKDIISAVFGSFTGGVGGAASASFMGANPLLGAAIGGTMSAAGGIADIMYNQAIRNETLDYTKDMYGYNLGNIKALPQSITKTTAFTINNKIFPILEFYSCTEEEKLALANKIAYNGMTVMRIGTIEEYRYNSWNYGDVVSKNYIKGKLIRLDEIEDDFHVANEIAAEMNKGVFL